MSLFYSNILARCLPIIFISIWGFAAADTNSDFSVADTNCVDGFCYGPVHVIVDGMNFASANAIGQFSCRIVGLNITATTTEAIAQDLELRDHRTLAIFVDDFGAESEILPRLNPPENFPDNVVSYTAEFEDIASVKPTVMVYSLNAGSCETFRCVTAQTVRFVERVYQRELTVDQEKYGSGWSCANDG